jgi:hypothetical protein
VASAPVFAQQSGPGASGGKSFRCSPGTKPLGGD